MVDPLSSYLEAPASLSCLDMIDHPTGAGATDGPISPDAFKRAVYRSAPRNFTVKLLPPEKQGSSYYYGIRVFPIKDDGASFVTRTTSSGASVVSYSEYDIYRKWEDCLWFQETIEVEYSRLARSKRNRLASGRGVKKNGVYIHSDQAASFESLPFGPDPDDIARDIHEHVPKLTKKGTLFRPSMETVDQRFEELRVMLRALFLDGLPTLIEDIKATHTFTDFFGVWRRDEDLVKKAQASRESRPRASTTSIISSYFSSSTPSHSTISLSPSKGKQPATTPRPSIHTDSSSLEDLAGSQRSRRSVESGRHRREELSPVRPRVPSGSLGSSSMPPTPVSPQRQLPSNSRQPIIVSHDAPIRFGHNPHAIAGERPTSLLESLPEDRELSSSPQSDLDADVWSQRRASSAARKANRTATIYLPSPPDLSGFSESPSESPARSLSRASRVSTATLRANYLDELGVDYCLPSADSEHGRKLHPRASISSVASIMTGYSVDAVIPHHERPRFSSRDCMRRPISLPEEPFEDDEFWNENDSTSDDQGEDFDAYFYDSIRPEAPTPEAYPQTPTVDDPIFQISQRMSTTTINTSSASSTYSDRRSSLTTSISSGSTGSSSLVDPMTLSIKATHEDNIVMLRLPRYTTFEELRQKIYEKFIQTGKSTISQSFAVALLVPEKPARGAGRPRATSLSSLGSTDSKTGSLHFIPSQHEWGEIASTYEGKMLLRIIGSRA